MKCSQENRIPTLYLVARWSGAESESDLMVLVAAAAVAWQPAATTRARHDRSDSERGVTCGTGSSLRSVER